MTTRNNGDRNNNGARNNDERRERLATGVRRQFGTEATMRFLRALPAFRTERTTFPIASGICSTAWTASRAA
ncbi:hypothetical protein [Mesorhizobium sp.]|uniref:hypothetical protein n=1 Tax=Mesorhizobium sp. TaxID=1871066 RepID=UPI00345DF466